MKIFPWIGLQAGFVAFFVYLWVLDVGRSAGPPLLVLVILGILVGALVAGIGMRLSGLPRRRN